MASKPEPSTHVHAAPLQCDFLVLGGGILGALITQRLSLKFPSVINLYLEHQDHPTAETLRNQGWAQSGERYASDELFELAVDMGLSGRELFEHVQLDSHAFGTGAIGFVSEEEYGSYVERAAKFRATMRSNDGPDWPDPAPLSHEEAGDLAGPLYEPGLTWLPTGEQTFPEDKILDRLRERAAGQGAVIRALNEPARVEWCGDRELDVRVITSERVIEPQRLILACGVGNIPLLDQLGCAEGFRVQRTPLLVAEPAEPVKAQVLVRKSEPKISAIKHEREGRQFLVVGGSEGVEVFSGVPEREFPNGTGQRLVNLWLPGVELNSFRITSGFEVLPPGAADIEPWVRALKEGGRAIAAFPGRATYAMRASDLVLDIDQTSDLYGEGEREGPMPAQVREGAGPEFSDTDFPGKEPEGDCRMHFDPYWEGRGMNDEH